MLLLAITDQFGKSTNVTMSTAQQAFGKLRGKYEKAYYSGIIGERWAKSRLRGREHPGLVSGFFREAMDRFAEAMALAPAGNDDAVLRWNACVRFLQQNPFTETEDADIESGF